jgi:hypothetical protein
VGGDDSADSEWARDFNELLYAIHHRSERPQWKTSYEDLCKLLTDLRTNDKGDWSESVRQAVANMVKDIWHEYVREFRGKDTLWAKECEPADYGKWCAYLIHLAYMKRDLATNERIIRYFRRAFQNITEPAMLSEPNIKLVRGELLSG